MTKLDLKGINGNEIIDYLNEVTVSDEEEIFHIWCDVSLYGGSYVFSSQEVKKGKYYLYFEADFDNWGECQPYDNYLSIDEDGKVTAYLDEPFEGDGSDSVIEEELEKWLETHDFTTDTEAEFKKRMEKANKLFPKITSSDYKTMYKLMDILTEAKTFMK
jgi:hypothetical protein